VKHLIVALSLVLVIGPVGAAGSPAGIPATSVMTLYQFNGEPGLPYYEIDALSPEGPSSPAGTLAQGTSLVPCLVIRDG